jgi:hypothetical protein
MPTGGSTIARSGRYTTRRGEPTYRGAAPSAGHAGSCCITTQRATAQQLPARRLSSTQAEATACGWREPHLREIARAPIGPAYEVPPRRGVQARVGVVGRIAVAPLVVRLPTVWHTAVITAPLPMSVPPRAQLSRLQQFCVTVERYAGVSSRIVVAPFVTWLYTVTCRSAGGPV